MRNNHRTACHCRAYATSDNGGESFAHFGYDAALPSPVCQATLSSAGGNLLFANPADAGEGFSNARMQGTIKKSTDMGAPSLLPLRALGLRAQAVAVHVGKTWARELHVTPLGLTPKEGGSYDYSCLVPSALKDDPTKGGLLCAPPNACPASAEGADRGVLGAQVVAQLRPGRVRPQSCAEGLLARTLLALSARLLSGCGERAASGRRWPALCGGVRQAFSPGDANFAQSYPLTRQQSF